MTGSARGFTLAEVLVVLAITGVVVGLAIPALGDTLARRRLNDTADALIESLQHGRAMAVRRRHPVRVCPSVDGRACSPGRHWTAGWIVLDEQAGTVLLHAGPAHRRLRTSGSARRDSIRFQPTGVSSGDNQRITLCVQGAPATARTLVISNAGRTRRETALPDEAAACAHARQEKRHDRLTAPPDINKIRSSPPE